MALSGPGLALCSLFTLYFGGSPVIYSPAPRGDCTNCCPIRESRDVRFMLYTRSNPVDADVLYLANRNRLESSNFNKSNAVIVYMHGFSEHVPGGPGQSSQEIRDAFLRQDEYNVILVDWSPITALPWYINAVQNIPRVGRYLARFLIFLIKNGADLNRIHMIGFSMGADVASFAARTLIEWNYKLPRITGLDPAFPFYKFENVTSRLSWRDAKFVDVIHTDGGVLGNPWPLGHADFYPNFYPNQGISLQPGCAKQELSKNRWFSIVVGCSHQRAWEYFVESINRPYSFLATRCEPNTVATTNKKDINCDNYDPANMGFNADKRLRGKFYLTTNSERPFSKS